MAEFKVLIVQAQVDVGAVITNIVLVIVVIGVVRFQFMQICVIRTLVHVCVLIKIHNMDRKEFSEA